MVEAKKKAVFAAAAAAIIIIIIIIIILLLLSDGCLFTARVFYLNRVLNLSAMV
jgi:hypothetical protein